jgi:hypothetical protein
MKRLIGLKGGNDATYFEVLDVKETTVKIYPSIKDGKVMSALETGLSHDFFKHKKEVAVLGYFATVAGNAVCAAEGIKDTLGIGYKAIAVNPNCVEIYSCTDYNAELERVCSNV